MSQSNRTVHVVSTVYWGGGEQLGGSFFWYHNINDAESAFEAEKNAWSGASARVRLVSVDIPPGIVSNEEITDYIDSDIDMVEHNLPARKVWISCP